MKKRKKIKRYRDGAGLDRTIDTAGRVGLNVLMPGLGEALSLTQDVSNIVRGDGDTFGQNLAADILDPLSPIKSIGQGRFEEAIPIAGSLFKRNRLRTEEEKREREEADIARRTAVRMSQNVLSGFDTSGVQGAQFKKGGKMKKRMKYLMGGDIESLSSDAVKFVGNTHEQGGIMLDDRNEVEDQEVMLDGSLILSDTLKPTEDLIDTLKNSGIRIFSDDTYASIGERVNRLKGDYEKNVNSSNRFEGNSSKIMINKLDNLSDLLFQDQEASKEIEASNQFQEGGQLEPPKFPFSREISRLFGEDEVLNQAMQFQQLPENVARQEREFDEFRELVGDTTTGIPIKRPSLDTEKPFIKRFFEMLSETTSDHIKNMIEPNRKIGSFKKGGVRKYQDGGDPPRNPSQLARFLESINEVAERNRMAEQLFDEQGQERRRLRDVSRMPNFGVLNPNAPRLQFPNEVNPFDQDLIQVGNQPTTAELLGISEEEIFGDIQRSPRTGQETVDIPTTTLPTVGRNIRNNTRNQEAVPRTVGPTLGREVLDLDIPIPENNTIIEEVSTPFTTSAARTAYASAIFDDNNNGQLPTTRTRGARDFLSNNLGQIANLANFIANENVIGRMETRRDPNLVAPPVTRVTDRTSQIRAMGDRSLREIIDAIDTGGVRDRNAAKAAALSSRIEADNAAILNELGRQDQLRAQYDNLRARVNMINTDILNQTDLENLSRENELLALRQANRDALVEGIVGNITERDRRRMQELAIRLISNRQGNRGVVGRMLENDPNLRELSKIFE